MPTPTPRHIVALGAVALALAPAAAAAATSHAKLWSDKANTVTCGIKIHPKNVAASQIICGAQGLPAPKHTVGDPFVQIAGHGRPRIVLLSQASYVTTHDVTLKPGAHWSALGIACTVQAKTAKCKNKAGHGFTIGKNLYEAF